ncbi:TPA: hypothetical protein ACH3X1_005839 [Trebouxia sp. C0004]
MRLTSWTSSCRTQPCNSLASLTRSCVSSCARDSSLLCRGQHAVERDHNPLAQLRCTSAAEHGFLRKAQAACHVTLEEVQAQYASSVQGFTECRQVAGQVAAAVAYHLLNGCKAHKEAETADWLAKLDKALLQAAVPQPGTTIKASYPCTVPIDNVMRSDVLRWQGRIA